MTTTPLVSPAASLTRERLLLYCYSFVVTATGLVAAGFATGAGATQVVIGLALAGYLISWVLSRSGVPQGYVAAGVALLFLLAWTYSPDWVALGLPPDSEIRLALLLAMIAAARSFTLYGPGDLLFAAVPSLAIFGLLASFVLDIRLLALFVVFVAASLLMLGQERRLRLLGQAGAALPSGRLRIHELTGTALYLAALLLTVALASPPLHWLGMRYNLPPLGLPEPTRTPAAPALAPDLLSVGSRISIGTGPINLGRGPVMYVEAKEGHYWRSMVYDTYTGRGWEAGPTSELGRKPIPVTWPVSDDERLLTQTYHLQIGISGPVFGVARPLAAEALGGTASGQFTCDEAGVLRAGYGLPAGASYRVVSRLPARPRDLPAPATWPVAGAYLQLNPGALPLRALAEAVTRNAPTPLRKAQAIQAFVRQRGRYTLNAPPVPPGEDAATWFITRSREGYCDLFASAMVLMCRAVNVPARLAVGFSTGTFDRERNCWQVDRQDAHAWPEVYLPGAGWVAFEPTPAAGRGGAVAPQAAARGGRGLVRWLPSLAGLLIVSGGLWLGLRRLRVIRPARRAPATPLGEMVACYLACCRLLAGLGLPRTAAQTPAEYLTTLARWAPALGLPEVVPPVSAITRLFTRARYSGRAVDPNQVAEMRALVAGLQRERRRLRRAARAARRTAPAAAR